MKKKITELKRKHSSTRNNTAFDTKQFLSRLESRVLAILSDEVAVEGLGESDTTEFGVSIIIRIFNPEINIL